MKGIIYKIFQNIEIQYKFMNPAYLTNIRSSIEDNHINYMYEKTKNFFKR